LIHPIPLPSWQQQSEFHHSRVNIFGDVRPDNYGHLYDTFYRTLIKARLSRGAAKAYFSYRLLCSGYEPKDQTLLDIFWSGIDEMESSAGIVKSEFSESPVGQWSWDDDLKTVGDYVNKMTKVGWEEYGGVMIKERKSALGH
jgi:hypothetical protein